MLFHWLYFEKNSVWKIAHARAKASKHNRSTPMFTLKWFAEAKTPLIPKVDAVQTVGANTIWRSFRSHVNSAPIAERFVYSSKVWFLCIIVVCLLCLISMCESASNNFAMRCNASSCSNLFVYVLFCLIAQQRRWKVFFDCNVQYSGAIWSCKGLKDSLCEGVIKECWLQEKKSAGKIKVLTV